VRYLPRRRPVIRIYRGGRLVTLRTLASTLHPRTRALLAAINRQRGGRTRERR